MSNTENNKPYSTVFTMYDPQPYIPPTETTEGKSYLKEYLAALIICIGPFAIGNAGGYSSPATADLDKPGRSFHLDAQQSSLMGSMMTIGALFGGLIAGIFADYLGRKTCIIYVSCPFVLGWLLIVYSNYVSEYISMMYAGRIICGLCVGILSMCGPTYLGEIASPEIRGALGSSFQLFMNIGIMFSYAVGWALTWSFLALVLSVVPILLMILMLLLPESPLWLIKKKRKMDAIDSLEWLRGGNANVVEEAYEMEMNAQNDGSMSIRDFLQPELRKPFILMFMEMFFQQFSGINAIVFNISAIFSAASKSMDPNLSSIIVALVMVVATIVGVFLIDRAGRRILLLISSVCLSISMMVMGGYYYIKYQDESKAESIAWLPIICLILFVSTFNIGYGPIPWLMMSEVFPSQAKGLASSIITACNWTFAFIITKTYTDFKEAIQDHGVFWFYGAICILSVFYTWIYVPETKGKTFQEIQQLFGGRRHLNEEIGEERF